MWLTAGTRNGLRLYRSQDGSNSTDGRAIPNLVEAFAETGYSPGEAVPRQLSGGRWALLVPGLGRSGAGSDTLFRLIENPDGRFSRDPAHPVFTAHTFIGVSDITPTVDGGLRLTYVARGVRNAASGAGVISPDSIFSIQGSHLTLSTESAGQYPLPTEISGGRVSAQPPPPAPCPS